MRISIFGLGYVGSVSAVCLAKLGHEVIAVDISSDKVDRMTKGEPPVLESGLGTLLAEVLATGRLRTTVDPSEAVRCSEMAMICVGTPSTSSGGVESKYLYRVAEQIGAILNDSDQSSFAVVNRSTCLPEVHAQVAQLLKEYSGRSLGTGISYVCHPEFLREGVAVHDFFDPPKIVFGCDDVSAEVLCRELYSGIEAQTFVVPINVASMVKYADNAFHALKVTFANEIGLLCKDMEIDSHSVMDVVCQDTKLNLSPRYLRPGFAFGGSCLTKDVRAIRDYSRMRVLPTAMLNSILDSNHHQIQRLVQRLTESACSRVGFVGLSFKEGTDDVRESPIVSLIEQLCGKGYEVQIYDECLSVAQIMGSNESFALQMIPHLTELIVENLQSIVKRVDVLVVSHRLSVEVWASLDLPPTLKVIDLTRIDTLQNHPGYEGLYW